MKKTTSVLLALCLTLVLALPALAVNHELLDIPFGSSQEEITEAMAAKTGVTPDEPDPTLDYDALTFGRTQPLVIFGHEAIARPYIKDDGDGLMEWHIRFQTGSKTRENPTEEELAEVVDEIIALFDDLSAEIQALYGPPTYGDLFVNKTYDFPIVGGQLDRETVRHAFMENESALLTTITDNIYLRINIENYGGLAMLDTVVTFWQPNDSRITRDSMGFQHENGGYQYVR